VASGVILAANAGSSAELQSRLLAQGKSENSRRVLPILQGMDTCGKDGVIRHVLRGLNPFGVRVASFEKPTRQDLAHHFLWRIKQQLPAPGHHWCIQPLVLRGRSRPAGARRDSGRRFGSAL
jgi:polyphosphate kinase 2 (PPK2 family)